MHKLLETEEIPGELLKSIEFIVNNFNRDEFIGWYPIKDYLWYNILNEETLGNIHPGEKVLDLGSGAGDSVLTWSYKGYSVTGIEIDKKLYTGSKELLKQYSDIMKAPVELFNGSYYPKKYIEERKNKERIQLIEEDLKTYLIEHSPSNIKHLKQRFKPVCNRDIYEMNNIDLKKIDIWFAYLWPYQAPSVFDMFIKYARDDAKILLISKFNVDMALRLNLETNLGSNIFRKRKDINYSFFDQ